MWGGLRQGTKSVQVVKPWITADFPEAVIGEGAEELTSRPEEAGSRRTFIDTTHEEAERWGPPLVDAHWYAFCQSHLPRSRRTRLGNDALLLQRLRPGGGNKEAWRESKGKGSMGHESDKMQRRAIL